MTDIRVPSYWELVGELKGTMDAIITVYNPTPKVKERLEKRIQELSELDPHMITVTILTDFSKNNKQ